jgi:hypothetical protein
VVLFFDALYLKSQAKTVVKLSGYPKTVSDSDPPQLFSFLITDGVMPEKIKQGLSLRKGLIVVYNQMFVFGFVELVVDGKVEYF